MKKLKKVLTSLLILSITTLCINTETDAQQNVFFEKKGKTTYNLNDQAQLNSLVKILAKETGTVELLEATFTELKDSKGTFKAISAKYRVGDLLTRFVVPVTHNGVAYVVDECEMKCTSAWGCQECTQTIIERCKSQTCSCSRGTGGCSSKITFPGTD